MGKQAVYAFWAWNAKRLPRACAQPAHLVRDPASPDSGLEYVSTASQPPAHPAPASARRQSATTLPPNPAPVSRAPNAPASIAHSTDAVELGMAHAAIHRASWHAIPTAAARTPPRRPPPSPLPPHSPAPIRQPHAPPLPANSAPRYTARAPRPIFPRARRYPPPGTPNRAGIGTCRTASGWKLTSDAYPAREASTRRVIHAAAARAHELLAFGQNLHQFLETSRAIRSRAAAPA